MPRTRWLHRGAWVGITALALMMAAIAAPYFSLDPNVFFSRQRALYAANLGAVMLHIAGAFVATVSGPFQFIARWRTGRLAPVHRWLGRIYMAGVFSGGAGALVLALMAYGGPIVTLGAGTLGVLWLLTAGLAIRHIRRRDIAAHRAWMLRNYALTFSAVTLRLWLIALNAAGLDFLPAYQIVAWLSWVPNLLLVQWLLLRERGAGAA